MGPKYVPGAEYVETNKEKVSRRGGRKKLKDEPNEPGPSSAPLTPTATSVGQPFQTPRPSVPASIGQSSNQPTRRPESQAPASQDAGKGAQFPATLINQTAVLPQGGRADNRDEKRIPSASAPPSKGTSLIHPVRPGYAGRGEKTAQLFANYFKLVKSPGVELHHYSITVAPSLKGNRLAQIIKNALDLEQFNTLRPGIATDFSGFLVSRKKLSDNDLNVSVPMATGLSADDLRNAKKYAVWFGLITTLDLDQIDLTHMHLADHEKLPLVQALDIVLGHYRKSSPNIAAVGKRKAFSMNSNPSAPQVELSDVLKAMRGFFSSVRFSENGALVNINVSNSPFWKGGQLVTLVSSLQRDPEINDTKIPTLLRGLRVHLTHVKDKTVIRTISGYAGKGDGKDYMLHPPRILSDAIGPGPQDVSFFVEKNPKTVKGEYEGEEKKVKAHPKGCACEGEWISVAKYFADKYHIHCQDEDNDQPVVNIGNKNHPAYVPLKVCEVLEQASKMKLNPHETKIMQKFAVRTPDKNATDIKALGLKTLGLVKENERLKPFGLCVDQEFVTVRSRVLLSPTLTYKSGTKTVRDRSKWDLGKTKFMDGKPLNNWSCLNIHYGTRPREDPAPYVKGFVKELNNCGIDCGPPNIENLRLDSINTAPGAESDWLNPKKGIRFLLIILPNKHTDLYNQIKRLGDQKSGLLTCCVVGADKKFYNPDSQLAVQYNANVALKINLKLGGVNHKLGSGQLCNIPELENQTMVIGIDVTHPSVGSSDNAPSIAALVASDKQLVQWPAELRTNTSRKEMVEKLGSMLESRLIWWKEKYNDLPKNLLIYRDGVSEGQYQLVLDEEMPQIRRACTSIYPPRDHLVQLPKISLVVVGKRHHTRFMRKTKDGGQIDSGNYGKASNPEPGTVVDNIITNESQGWDFFLQSHKPIQGTARPAHYFVLVDEIFRQWPKGSVPRPFQNPAEILEQVTHHMCFLFGRATLSVSIPPPVYYADIACERGRRYLAKYFDPRAKKLDTSNITDDDVQVHPSLRNNMFYI